MTKTTTKKSQTTPKKAKTVAPFEPTRVALGVSALAALTLVIFALLTSIASI